MGQLRFQRTVSVAGAAMAGSIGLVALWPHDWHRLAAGDWSQGRSVAMEQAVFWGPAACIFVLRRSIASRVVATLLFLCFLGFAGRWHLILTDPTFDRHPLFTKMDPFVGLYGLVFGVGGWLLALVAAPFVLLRRFEAKRTDVRDA